MGWAQGVGLYTFGSGCWWPTIMRKKWDWNHVCWFMLPQLTTEYYGVYLPSVGLGWDESWRSLHLGAVCWLIAPMKYSWYTIRNIYHCWFITSVDIPSLVGGFNPSEKYESVGMIIPNIWKVIKFMFQTTNQILLVRFKPLFCCW